MANNKENISDFTTIRSNTINDSDISISSTSDIYYNNTISQLSTLLINKPKLNENITNNVLTSVIRNQNTEIEQKNDMDSSVIKNDNINNNNENYINNSKIITHLISTTTKEDMIIDEEIKRIERPNETIIEENESTTTIGKNKMKIPLINRIYDIKLVIGLGIFIPLIIIMMIVWLIVRCIRKRRKRNEYNYDMNRINFANKGNKIKSYNKLQDTSGLNVGMNVNNNSISEIKVKNLKEEIHNIITNSSGGSNSSGKRKRDKKKLNNKNNNLQGNKGIQNEIKDQIKQFVFDESINKDI